MRGNTPTLALACRPIDMVVRCQSAVPDGPGPTRRRDPGDREAIDVCLIWDVEVYLHGDGDRGSLNRTFSLLCRTVQSLTVELFV